MIRRVYIIPISGSQDAAMLNAERIRVGNIFNTDRQKLIINRSTEAGESTMDVMVNVDTFADLTNSANKVTTLTTSATAPLTSVTQSPGDNSTKVATTAYVDAAVIGPSVTLSEVLTNGNDATDQSILNLQAVHNVDGTRDTWVYVDATLAKQVYLYGSNSAPINGGDYFSILGNTTTVDDPLVSLSVYSGATISQTVLLVKKAQILITGTHATFAGAVYAADYSANYTTRSLVDKGYVDGLVTGYVPTSRTLTVNGSTQDLSANRTWTITVTGTINRIAVGDGATLTPVIDISPSYVGQSSITTLGTITTGTWNASLIGTQYGGTGADNTGATVGAVPYYSSSTVQTFLAATATAGQMLRSGASAAPTWSTNVWPNTTAIDQVLYATAANVIGGGANFTFNGTVLKIGHTTAKAGLYLDVLGILNVRAALGATFLSWVDNGTNAYRCLMNLATATADFSLYTATGVSGAEVFTERLRILNATGEMGLGVTPVAGEMITAYQSRNGAVSCQINNNNGGTSAYAVSNVTNGTTFTQLYHMGTAWTSGAFFFQSAGALASNGANGLSIGATNAAGVLRFYAGGTAVGNKVGTWNPSGVLKLAGTATRATTEGTNHLDIFDGTAPVGTLANGISLYSTAGELRVMDAGGNATLLSPHEKGTNYWIYDSIDTTTGKRLKIDMEQFMKWLNKKFGTDFVHEYTKENN